ncbi:MAG TPA: hypothetical protein VGC89_18295, partial [Pyrinomonadaceae bacterium]
DKRDIDNNPELMARGQRLFERIKAERAAGLRALPLAELPRFTYEPQTLRVALKQARSPALALMLFNVLGLILAHLCFARYDVR